MKIMLWLGHNLRFDPVISALRQSVMRETQISQFFRYAKISQLSLGLKKYRFVGEICIFESSDLFFT